MGAHPMECQARSVGVTVRRKMTQAEVKARIVVNDAGCWIWQGSMQRTRASVYPILGSTSVRKMAFEAFVGEFPPASDLALMAMSCGNERCINPDHLEVGAGGAMFAAGARAKREATHCVHGHEYAAVGVYINTAGGRVCRACVSERGKARWARRKHEQSQG